VTNLYVEELTQLPDTGADTGDGDGADVTGVGQLLHETLQLSFTSDPDDDLLQNLLTRKVALAGRAVSQLQCLDLGNPFFWVSIRYVVESSHASDKWVLGRRMEKRRRIDLISKVMMMLLSTPFL
jgi:hypothetical protein